jgi:NADPH:quinone reductase-like Zn-dependent oxidoreductase
MNVARTVVSSVITISLACYCLAQAKPVSMQAIQYHPSGSSGALQYDDDVPTPSLGLNDVLIRVEAAGVNPTDADVRSTVQPYIPGFDVTGDIVAVGSNVTTQRIGSHVMAMLPISGKGGGYAQYAAVSADLVAPRPSNLDAAHAAAVPLAALTAYQALFDQGHLKRGQTVLIHGASGGVGHFAVQFAKNAGARVIGTASADNVAFLKSLGADVVIDYKAQRFEDVARNVDLVIDTVGHDTLQRSFAVIRRGGTLVSLLERPDAQRLVSLGLYGTRTIVTSDGRELSVISELIGKNAVHPTVAKIFPLREAAQAQDALHTGHMPGKIVLLVTPSPDGA